MAKEVTVITTKAFDVALDDALEGAFIIVTEDTIVGLSEGTPKDVLQDLYNGAQEGAFEVEIKVALEVKIELHLKMHMVLRW